MPYNGGEEVSSNFLPHLESTTRNMSFTRAANGWVITLHPAPNSPSSFQGTSVVGGRSSANMPVIHVVPEGQNLIDAITMLLVLNQLEGQ
jgi:hypothetical protein